MLSALHQRGFTLVELLIGMTLLAVLIGLGVPAMGSYLQNSKLASVAASYFSGLQMARTEAIRRNVRTEFVLTETPCPLPTSRTRSLRRSAAATGWSGQHPARRLSLPPSKPSPVPKGRAAPSLRPSQVAGSASAPAVFDGRIPFNGFGATADGAPYSIEITRPGAGTCVHLGGTIRCRRINVSPGGQITSCDPAAAAGRQPCVLIVDKARRARRAFS